MYPPTSASTRAFVWLASRTREQSKSNLDASAFDNGSRNRATGFKFDSNRVQTQLQITIKQNKQ
jgi:hypothetical protein